jgi:hypothetical protein
MPQCMGGAPPLWDVTKPDARRIDYRPNAWAQRILEEASAEQPDMSQQALIDKLVILGRWAQRLQLAPPVLPGRNRRRWREPR